MYKCPALGLFIILFRMFCLADCGKLSPTGGTASTPKGTTYGEVAIVSCEAGYTLNGTAFITCQSNGTWSDMPTCDIKGNYLSKGGCSLKIFCQRQKRYNSGSGTHPEIK